VISLDQIQETRGLTPPHQKCDAKRPCTTCVNGDRGAECAYKPWQPSRRTSADVLSVSRERPPAPPNVRNLTSQASADIPSEPPINPLRDLPRPTRSGFSEFGSSLFPFPLCERPSTPVVRPPWELSPRIYDQILLGSSSDASVVQWVRGTTNYVPRPTVPSFTIFPSIHFQTIHRPLRIPLSLIPPERLQVSDVSGSDLHMT